LEHHEHLSIFGQIELRIWGSWVRILPGAPSPKSAVDLISFFSALPSFGMSLGQSNPNSFSRKGRYASLPGPEILDGAMVLVGEHVISVSDPLVIATGVLVQLRPGHQ